MPAARARRRPPAATLARRWLAVLLVVMIGYAYYHPLRSWFETRSELHASNSEVTQLAALEAIDGTPILDIKLALASREAR